MHEQMLKEAKRWAVLGVTTDEDKFGYKIYKRLKDRGYTVYGVSPKYTEVDGDKLYSSLEAIDDTIDAVAFVVNPAIGIQYIDKIKALGIKNIWLQPGTVDDALLDRAKEVGLNAVEGCILVVTNYQ